MQLQSLYHRVFDRTRNQASVHGLPEILDDNFQDTEALIIRPPFVEQPETQRDFIALVGSDPKVVLEKGILFNPGDRPPSRTELRAIELPTDAQRAMNVLLQLEHAEMILFVLEAHERLSSHHLHWLMRIEILKVPVVLLVNGAEQVHKRLLSQTLNTLKTRLNLPVVPVFASEPEQTRVLLVETLLDLSTRLAANMSLQLPVLRPIVVQHLLTSAAQKSMALDAQPEAGHLTNIYAEMATIRGAGEARPRRYVLVRCFGHFFQQHPELDNFAN